MNTTQTNAAWLSAKPFPHCVIDGFLPESLCAISRRDVQEIPALAWHQYDSPFERGKSACTLPEAVGPLRDFCHSPQMIAHLERLTGIAGLITDPSLHGGGFHRTVPGGYLDLHLDYSHHPKLNLERTLTLIIYLSSSRAGSGFLQLWDPDKMKQGAFVRPVINRAVIFQNTPKALHGHPDALSENDNRYSFACFYHTAPKPESVARPRALFFSRPEDTPNPEKDRLRAERAGFKAAV